MQAYGRLFARVYNEMWQNYANRVSPLIYDFYTETSVGEREKSLLDVCCGTGQLAGYFLERGFYVVGLDSSDDMLIHARKNTLPYMVGKQAYFVQGDAACFEIDDEFGLAVSTFDALNHLPDKNSLEGCFQSVHQILVDGGYFIFDLNTAKGLKNWNSLSIHPGEDIFYLNRGIYDASTVKAWTKITGFVRNDEGLYERFDETVYNTVFEMDEVRDMLNRVGYKSVYTSNGQDLKTPIENPENEKKVFFVAQK
jgi:SAM-dependent methyltransferase